MCMHFCKKYLHILLLVCVTVFMYFYENAYSYLQIWSVGMSRFSAVFDSGFAVSVRQCTAASSPHLRRIAPRRFAAHSAGELQTSIELNLPVMYTTCCTLKRWSLSSGLWADRQWGLLSKAWSKGCLKLERTVRIEWSGILRWGVWGVFPMRKSNSCTVAHPVIQQKKCWNIYQAL